MQTSCEAKLVAASLAQYALRLSLPNGEEILLRQLNRGDAKALRRPYQQERSWLEPWEVTTPGVELAPLGSFPLYRAIKQFNRAARAGRGVVFAICLEEQIIGLVSVAEIVRGGLQSCQLGYWIAEQYAGRGIVPHSVAAVIDWLLLDVGLHRVEIGMVPENLRSRRVVEKLGLRFEGRRLNYIYINGRWQHHDFYAVTIEEAPDGILQAEQRF